MSPNVRMHATHKNAPKLAGLSIEAKGVHPNTPSFQSTDLLVVGVLLALRGRFEPATC
jgi:hypothetical protein